MAVLLTGRMAVLLTGCIKTVVQRAVVKVLMGTSMLDICSNYGRPDVVRASDVTYGLDIKR